MIQNIAAASSSEALHKSSMPPADAWPLTDAAHVFASDDDLAEIKRLDDEIEQKSKFLNEWIFDPSETVKKMTGWDSPGATQAEIDERRSQGWSEDRIDNWMYSRHFWLRAAARAPLLTSSEIEAGSLRADIFTHEAASDAIELITANRKKSLEREIVLAMRQQERLKALGVFTALKLGTAIAYGRHQSLRAPFIAIQASLWSSDELILKVDPYVSNPNSVCSTDGTILFTDVRVALAKKAQRHRAIAEGNKKSSARAGKQCEKWLTAEMAASPNVRPYPKNEVYRIIARAVFGHIADKPFHGYWKAGIKTASATSWTKSGAPGKPQAITKCEKLIAGWVTESTNVSDELKNKHLIDAQKEIPGLSKDSFFKILADIKSLYDRCKGFQLHHSE